MRLKYAKERIEFFESLPDAVNVLHDGALWSLSPESLRFKHGLTLAELKVPYHLGSEDESVVEAGVVGLAALIKKRYESLKSPLREDEHSPKSNVFVATPQLRVKTCRLDIFVPGSFESALAARILDTTPYVDSALLYAWLSPGESGGKFLAWLRTMVKKARNDEIYNGLQEQTSYLTLLALIKSHRKYQRSLKNFRIKGLGYEKLDMAVGLSFFNVFSAVLEELTENWSAGDSISTVLSSALLPEYFMAVQSGFLNTSHNPYGLCRETIDALRPAMLPISVNTESLRLLVEEGVKRVRSDKGLLRTVIEQVKIRSFREKVLDYMKGFDIPDQGLRKELFELYGDDRLISNLIKDERFAIGLAARLEELAGVVAKDRARAGKLSELRGLVIELSKKRSVLRGLAGGGKAKEREALVSVVEGFYALDLDAMIGENLRLMMKCLTDRRGELGAKMLRDEYVKGRLYRFSTDKRPMINTLQAKKEGQLFIDMKDFSRKTQKIKEVAMADFMKEYFFKPILDAAKGYADGEGLSEDEMGIRLTNIPGDAIIFSGGVRSLVALARDIHRILKESGRELEQRLPPGGGRELMDEVHRRFEERREALKQKRLEMIIDIEGGVEDSADAILKIGEEETRLESVYKEELTAAIKHEMEAGLFITYGARAEIIELGHIKGYQGPVNVSIGEKINESARGTFRNSMVKAYLEILLSGDREKRRKPELQYPFDVYIHTAYTLRMPPDLEHAFEKLISGRKTSNAKALTRLITENYLKDFNKIIDGESFSSLRLIASITDIYNKGQALSDEALLAYIKESRGEKAFFRKITERENLHESIREAFFLPQEQMEFIFSAGPKNSFVEIFYRAGELIFRGFEAEPPRGIYEMLDPEGEFFEAIVESHLEDWLAEAAEAGEESL
ncbi:MAG: hypothetical protein ACE5DW_04485 [Thermodesulfobacteriota bacterium]